MLVDGVIEELKEKYPGTSVSEYLEEVRHHLLDNLDPFKEREGEGEERSPEGLPKVAPKPARAGARSVPRLRRERHSGAQRRRRIAGHF